MQTFGLQINSNQGPEGTLLARQASANNRDISRIYDVSTGLNLVQWGQKNKQKPRAFCRKKGMDRCRQTHNTDSDRLTEHVQS